MLIKLSDYQKIILIPSYLINLLGMDTAVIEKVNSQGKLDESNLMLDNMTDIICSNK